MALTTFLFGGVAAAAGFPNDTSTQFNHQGQDCGVVWIEDAFLTNFGESGTQGIALVIQATVFNESFNKDMIVAHQDGHNSLVKTTPDWWRNEATVFYHGQSHGRDRIVVIDRYGSLARPHSFSLQMKMAGKKFSCSGQVVDIAKLCQTVAQPNLLF